MTGWVDSHCHLTDERVGVPAVEAAAEAGVDLLVTVGCTVPDSIASLRIAAAVDGVVATAGVHPHDARLGTDGLETLLVDGVDGAWPVAVGEAGLDYHYDNSPRDVQRAVFAEQIQLAHTHELALVIHSRSAWDDTFDVLAAEGMPERTVFHCFTGGPVEARRALDMGAHLSFSGIVTFKSAPELREAAQLCPADRLLVETDSPYLAPVPHRGRTNAPAYVAVVGAAVAEVRGASEEDVRETTAGNARRFFAIV